MPTDELGELFHAHTLFPGIYIGQKAQLLMVLRVTQGVKKAPTLFHFTICLENA